MEVVKTRFQDKDKVASGHFNLSGHPIAQLKDPIIGGRGEEALIKQLRERLLSSCTLHYFRKSLYTIVN